MRPVCQQRPFQSLKSRKTCGARVSKNPYFDINFAFCIMPDKLTPGNQVIKCLQCQARSGSALFLNTNHTNYMAEKNFTVLSLGGSLIVPDEVDKEFLLQFKNFVLKWARRGRRFFIVTGGGKTARKYQAAAKELGVKDKNALDQMGIYATCANAELLRSFFGKTAHPEIITDYAKKFQTNSKVIVAPGWKPGCSTDFDAVYAACVVGAKRIINLSNIDCLYDKDPKAFSDAEPIKSVTFSDLLKITGKIWTPGANTPFDPKASQLAQKNKIEAIIANGKNLNNLDNILSGQPFIGTTVTA